MQYLIERYPDQRNESRWRLLAPNGKIVAAASQGYNRPSDLLHNLRTFSTELPKVLTGSSKYLVEEFQDANNQWRWRFSAPNGRILVTGGEGYQRKTKMLNILKKIAEVLPSLLLTFDNDVHDH